MVPRVGAHCYRAIGLTRRAAWSLAFVLVTAAEANAGVRDAESPPETIEPGVFHLRQLDLSPRYETSFDQIRVRSKQGTNETRQTNSGSINRWLTNINLAGDLVHPYLLDYYGSIGIGYAQDYFREQRLDLTQTDRPGGFLSEYDLRADLFKNKPISGTVYGLRGEDRVDRQFLPSLHEDRNGYGTAWVFKDATLPMRLSYDHLDTQRTGNADRLDDEHVSEDHLRYGAEWKISEYQKLKLDYDHSRLQQAYQGSDFNFDTFHDQVRLDHELAFGPEHQHRFVNFFRYQEESGSLARDIMELGPQLTLQHTPDLSTHYAYQFTREKYQGTDVSLNRADFEVRHQFLKNLTTTLDLFGLQERTEQDVQTDQGGASIDWDYTRKNPYGQFSADLRLAGDSERTHGSEGLRLMLNESGTFRDPLPLLLSRPHVAPTSIVVKDTTGRIIYLAIKDYTFVTIQDRTALYRVPTGRITDGQTVFIDYRYRMPKNGGIDTTSMDFSLQQAFSNGFTPYYRFNFRQQEVDRSTGFAYIPSHLDHHRIGATYQRPRWSANVEYEIFDDTFDPYNAFHSGGSVNAIRGDQQSLDFRADFSKFFFKAGLDKRDVSETNLSAHYEFQFNNRWDTSLNAAWRWENDSIRGNINGLDLKSALTYRLGKMAVELSAGYGLLDLPESQEDSLSVWLSWRWNFGDLLRTR